MSNYSFPLNSRVFVSNMAFPYFFSFAKVEGKATNSGIKRSVVKLDFFILFLEKTSVVGLC